MKENRYYSNYHGKFINNRVVKGLSLGEAVYAPHLRLSKHSHRNPGFCLILQGEYVESYDGASLDCQPLNVKFQPAGEAHTDFYGNTTVRSFIVELESGWLKRTGADVLVGNSPLVFRNNSLTWLMTKLRKEFHSADVEASLAIEGLALELIAETSRNRAKFSGKNSFSGEPRWLRQAKELLDEQFSESLTLSVVADAVGVHPVYLANSFRRHYQRSVGEYLRERRIEFASRRVSDSKDSIADIALSAGFSNQAHFSRVFKQITGMSPARYRAVCRIS
jgi:AraC family transcriptional regulator